MGRHENGSPGPSWAVVILAQPSPLLHTVTASGFCTAPGWVIGHISPYPHNGRLFVPFPRDCIRHVAGLLDHLIRLDEEHRRDSETVGLRSLEVEDQLESRRLFHGESGGLGALERLVHVLGGAMPETSGLYTIRHESIPLILILCYTVLYRHRRAAWQDDLKV
jgi:hypothetical protein